MRPGISEGYNCPPRERKARMPTGFCRFRARGAQGSAAAADSDSLRTQILLRLGE
jgi:hypothetical protein